MVNLESNVAFNLGEYSSLHEILLPQSSANTEHKLILRSSYLSYTPTSPSSSPSKHYNNSRGGEEGVASPLPPSLSSPGGAPTPSPSPDRHGGGGLHSSSGGGSHSIRSPEDISSPNQRMSPLDIVSLATQEIKKTEDSLHEEKGRVTWNLAGLLQPPDPSLSYPPGYPAPPPHPSAYSPHHHLHSLQPPEVSSGYNFSAAAMGVSAAPGLSSLPLSAPESSPAQASGSQGGPPVSSSEGGSQPPPVSQPQYKMEPMDTSMYYSGAESADPHNPASSVFQGGLENQDVMQTLHQYLQPAPPDLPHHDSLSEGGWLDPSLHAGLFPHQEYDYRCYTDRKKKIIREWNKNNTSPRASDALGGAGDPLRTHPYMGDFLSHGYPAPYGVKDEPLRPDYYSAYAAYGAESLVNPYAHMGRREKRKKHHDSLSGGNTMTRCYDRDERKAQAMGLPITCNDIINLPMDEFNDLLSKHELTEEQLTLCRDIRRRGKNKVAAQNCRKRKIDIIKQLETEVTRIKCRKTELLTDREKLIHQKATWTDINMRLQDYILKEMGHDPVYYDIEIEQSSRQAHVIQRNPPDHSRGAPSHHHHPGPPHHSSMQHEQARLGGVPGGSNAGMFDPRGGNGGHGMLTDHHGRGAGQQHDPLAMEHQLAMHQEHLNDKTRAYNMGLRQGQGAIQHPVPIHPMHPS